MRVLFDVSVWLAGVAALYAAGQEEIDPLVIACLVLLAVQLVQLVHHKLAELLFGDPADAWQCTVDILQALARRQGMAELGWHVVEDIGLAFGLAWATLTIPSWGSFEWGQRDDREMLSIPLVAQGQEVGTLALGPKPHGVPLSAEERHALDAMAPAVAIRLREALAMQALERRLNQLGQLKGVALDAEEEIRSLSSPPQVIPLKRHS